jgi:hypothetical protein
MKDFSGHWCGRGLQHAGCLASLHPRHSHLWTRAGAARGSAADASQQIPVLCEGQGCPARAIGTSVTPVCWRLRACSAAALQGGIAEVGASSFHVGCQQHTPGISWGLAFVRWLRPHAASPLRVTLETTWKGCSDRVVNVCGADTRMCHRWMVPLLIHVDHLKVLFGLSTFAELGAGTEHCCSGTVVNQAPGTVMFRRARGACTSSLGPCCLGRTKAAIGPRATSARSAGRTHQFVCRRRYLEIMHMLVVSMRVSLRVE